MTARQVAAQRDMALVAELLRGAPGEAHRGVEFWTIVARNVCARHGVRTLLNRSRSDLPPTPEDPLDITPQQRRILALLAEGATRDDIAAKLFLSERTVKKHLYMVNRRIGARNVVHAVALAIRAGLI